MRLKVQEGLPFSIGKGFAFPPQEELEEDANGVGEHFGVEFLEYLAFRAVVVLPG